MSSGDVTQYKDIKHMNGCLQKCCTTDKCDLAYLIDNTCYTVKCFSKDLCKVRPVETSGVNSKLTYVQRSGIEMFETKDDAMIVRIESHATEAGVINVMPKIANNRTETVSKGTKKDKNLNETITAITHQTKTEKEHCQKGETHFNVRLRGDLGAGVFTANGLVTSMEDCARICCKNRSCDLAYMVGNTCYSVNCYSKELCQVEMATPLALNPTVAYVMRYSASNRDQGKLLVMLDWFIQTVYQNY